MNIKKISRIPKRIKDDLHIISITDNWLDVLSAKLSGKKFGKISFRNGLVLESPEQVRLDLLFHEVWVEQMYTPAGFQIKDNDTILDIGANIGVFSVFAATAAENVKVLAYEPFPDNAEWLRRNVKANKLDNIQVNEKAVAGESGKRTLEVSDAWVMHSLKEKKDNSAGMKIDCISLDEAMENIQACDLMKIDCEGSEYEIFYSSSADTLKKIKKIVGEYHQLNETDMNCTSLCNYLNKNDFIITDLKSFGDGTGSFCARRN